MRIGGAEVRALGGVKAARWCCALCMLVLAVANAHASIVRIVDWRTTWSLPTMEIERRCWTLR